MQIFFGLQNGKRLVATAMLASLAFMCLACQRTPEVVDPNDKEQVVPSVSQGVVQEETPKPNKIAVPRTFALPEDKIEAVSDQLGREIARSLQKQPISAELLSWAEAMWPKVAPVWRAYAEKGQTTELQSDPELSLVFEFFFGSPESERETLQYMGQELCWGRLDRVWFAIAQRPCADNMVSWGKCPLMGLPYMANAQGVSCPHHGITLTYPHHLARPSVNELYRQLLEGQFTHDNVDNMDVPILGNQMSAIRSGETVLDLGCGVGNYTWTMCQAVGPQGKVLASDIDSDVLKFVDFVKEKRQAENVTTLHVSPIDPGVEANSLDRVFMIDVFNDFAGLEFLEEGQLNARTEQYLRLLVAGIKNGGHLVIVDRQPSPESPHIPAPTVADLLAAFGMRAVDLQDAVLSDESMYILTLERSAEPPAQGN